MPRLFVIGVWILPGVSRLQNFARDIGAHDWNMNAENRVRLRGNIGQPPVERRANHRARVGDLHPMPFAVRPAGPAGVDQPTVGMVFGYALAQQLRVNARMMNHEWRAE